MDDQPVLITERLILRPFKLSDAKHVQKLAGNKLVASTTQNIPHPYLDGMAEEWIGTHESKYIEGEGVAWAITSKNNDELIGAISLMSINEGHQAELGYWIGVPYWNKGYCTEAATTVLHYGFTDRGLNRIHARYFTRNPASGRVMRKLGMRPEGTRKQHVMKWGAYEDVEMMGILRVEWETMNKE